MCSLVCVQTADRTCSGTHDIPTLGPEMPVLTHRLMPAPVCFQDLKCLVFSLINAHFKIKPIQR